MTLSNYELASQSLANEIIIKDMELAAKIYEKNINVDEIYQLFRQRLYLYDKASNMPLSRHDRLLLDTKKSEIGMELKFFRFKQDVEEEVKEIISRLSYLDSQIVTLKGMSHFKEKQ